MITNLGKNVHRFVAVRYRGDHRVASRSWTFERITRRLCCFIRSKPQFKSVSAKTVKIVCFFSNVSTILFIAE